jgi:two-component system nitrogen regulation response regulator GlnG
MASEAKTIIVADSDEEVRKELFFRLSTKGYEVKITDSASDLIREVEKTSGIIVLDVELSGMKAYEMIPLVKKVNPKLPIIVMSASSSVELAQKIRNEGIFFYAMKPIDADEIETVVEGAFRKLEHETARWEPLTSREPKP